MAVISTAKKRDPYITKPEIKKYTVWVDNQEVTTGFITYTAAKMLHGVYKERGVSDVIIREGRNGY